MIYWAQLFYLCQPPTQLPPVLDKICPESYGPLLQVFPQHPEAKATVNINGVLTETLKDCGHLDIIQGPSSLVSLCRPASRPMAI